ISIATFLTPCASPSLVPISFPFLMPFSSYEIGSSIIFSASGNFSTSFINFSSSSSVNFKYVFRKLGIRQSFRRCLSCTYAERKNRHILSFCQKTRKSVALLLDRVPFWLSCAKIPFSPAHVLFHHIPFY